MIKKILELFKYKAIDHYCITYVDLKDQEKYSATIVFLVNLFKKRKVKIIGSGHINWKKHNWYLQVAVPWLHGLNNKHEILIGGNKPVKKDNVIKMVVNNGR